EAVQEQVPFMVAAGDDDEMDASCLPVVSPRCDPDRMLVDIDELRYGHESGSLFTIMSGFARMIRDGLGSGGEDRDQRRAGMCFPPDSRQYSHRCVVHRRQISVTIEPANDVA